MYLFPLKQSIDLTKLCQEKRTHFTGSVFLNGSQSPLQKLVGSPASNNESSSTRRTRV